MNLNDKNGGYNVVSSFSDNPRYDFGSYAKGYHKAAKLLTDIFFTKNGYADYEGYPIVFLYRHAFELNLKNIIYWGVRLSEFKNLENFDNTLHNHHSLVELAKESTKILNVLFKNDAALKDVIKNINLIAKEYTDLDKDSFSYRYPIDKKGNYSSTEHQIVNITSLSSCMEDLLNSMEAINFGLNVETDQIQEIFEILSNFSLN